MGFKHQYFFVYVVVILAVSFFIFPSVLAEDLPATDDSFLGDGVSVGMSPVVQEDEFFKAVILNEPTERAETEYGQFFVIQDLRVRILNGPETGKEIDLEFEIPEGSPGMSRLAKSDKVILAKSSVGGEELYYVSDVYRLDTLWFVLGIFFLLVVALARFAGLRAILGLFLSFVIIVWFIVPRIIEGQNALFIGFMGTLGIAIMSLYVAHGFRSRTHIAFSSTLITVFLALFFASFFTKIMHLFGLGSEEAFFLQTAPEKIFNLRGILVAGIIIGVLGVLDDITTGQAAVVEEIHLANPSLGLGELFKRGFSVGREHIISLVNTLVLAYTGASLPLLLLFQIYSRPTWLVMNSEIIMEELIRMLIGSIALLLAVPLTTFLAARYYSFRGH